MAVNEFQKFFNCRLLVKDREEDFQNPHWIVEAHTQHPQKLNVWAGIVANRIIGPFFFEETLTGERYLEFLQNDLVPALAVIFPNENDPNIPDNTLWFQQDGTPPHYARSALRNRAMQLRLNRKPLACQIKPGSVIENVANTRRLAETTLGPTPIEEQATNTGSGSGDEDDDVVDADCHVISNDKSTEFILATVVEEAALKYLFFQYQYFSLIQLKFSEGDMPLKSWPSEG
ncbi:hypothetical protein NQ318_006197 [Aromia moschata]|uniref:Uncharacterized protein n=1 Tax=Aromia moschata TaxID=1265417 RepID=A0AAV8YFL4_9CUCU|nr:hypothetical protein NQ318_006197 [Aromia moschata]